MPSSTKARTRPIEHAVPGRRRGARVTRGAGLRARWQALFQDVDVVLCPPMPTASFPQDHSPQFSRLLEVDGKKAFYNDQSVWPGSPR